MNVPSRTHRLAGWLECEPHSIDEGVLQDHVIRHPFGLAALHGRVFVDSPPTKRPWNLEGWDHSTPPVLTLAERRALVANVRALRDGPRTCRAELLDKEIYGGRAIPDDRPCETCPSPLRGSCANITHEIAERYAAHVDALLREVSEENGIVVARTDLYERLVRDAVGGGAPESLVVLTAGTLGTSDAPGVRIQRGDGVRLELYRHHRALRWRTLYRVALGGPNARMSFLLKHLSERGQTTRDSLSGNCVVPRLWWQGPSHVS